MRIRIKRIPQQHKQNSRRWKHGLGGNLFGKSGGNPFTVGATIDSLYASNPREEFLGEPAHHYDFTQSEKWADAHGYYPDARGHRDDRVKKPAHPSHPSRGTWNGDNFILSDLGMQNPNYTLFGLNDGGQDPQATLTYKGGIVLPEITVTPKENYIFNPYDNIILHQKALGGNLFGDGGDTKANIPVTYFTQSEAMPLLADNPNRTAVLDEVTVKPYKKLPMQSELFQGITNQSANEKADEFANRTSLTPERFLGLMGANVPLAAGALGATVAAPALFDSTIAPISDYITGSSIAGVPTTTWLNTGMEAGFAGHGLNHAVNEGVDGWGDAAMTALEVAPLGKLAKPVYEGIVQPGMRLFNSPLTENWTTIGNRQYRLNPNSLSANGSLLESRSITPQITAENATSVTPIQDVTENIFSPDYLANTYINSYKDKSKYIEDIANDMYGLNPNLQLVDYNAMNEYGKVFNERIKKILPLAKKRGTLRTEIQPNIVVADGEGRNILYDRFINDTPILRNRKEVIHWGDPVTSKGKLAKKYYYMTRPAEGPFDAHPSSFADRENNTIVVIPRTGYKNMYKYTVPHEKTHIFIDGRKEAQLFGTDRGFGVRPHKVGDTDIQLDLYLARPDEQLARGTQIKNYLGITDESPITAEQLKYAAENYVKDTGYDNNMTEFFSTIKDYKKAAKWLSRAPVALPFIGGSTAATLYNKSK